MCFFLINVLSGGRVSVVFFIVLILLSIIINKILVSISEQSKRPILLPIALQGSYFLLQVFGGLLLTIYLGIQTESYQILSSIVFLTGLIWFFYMPSLGPIFLLTTYHIISTLMNLFVTLPESDLLIPGAYSEMALQSFITHTIFRIIVIWLMFSRIRKI